MNIFNIVKKKSDPKKTSKYDQKNTLKLLYYLADADGFVSSEEEILIRELSNTYGVGEIEVRSIVEEFKNEPIEKAKIQYPTQQNQIEYVIKDLICVMIADKKIKVSELTFILKIAKKLNQDISVIEKILHPYIFGNAIGHSIEAKEIKKQLQEVWIEVRNNFYTLV